MLKFINKFLKQKKLPQWRIYLNEANEASHKREHEQAYESASQAIEELVRLGDKPSAAMAFAHFIKGRAMVDMRKGLDSVDVLKRSLTLYDEVQPDNYRKMRLYVLIGIAEAYYFHEQPDLALENFEQLAQLDLAEIEDDHAFHCSLYSHLMDLYEYKDNYAKALEYGEQYLPHFIALFGEEHDHYPKLKARIEQIQKQI